MKHALPSDAEGPPTDAVPKRTLAIVEPRLGLGRGHYDELANAIVAGWGHSRGPISIRASSAAAPIVEALGDSIATLDPLPASSWAAEARACAAAAANGSHVLVMTASGKHALALSAGTMTRNHLERIDLLFHWPLRRFADRALHRCSRSARRHARALATTEPIAEDLRRLGWRSVQRIDYPVIAPPPPQPTPFRHVLMAGALRFNKGLAVLAELVERWSIRGAEIPLLLQSSTKHAHRHGRREAPLLRRIEAAGYPHLEEQGGDLDRDRYLANFRGAITLAAYDPRTFAGQVSGVALDALLSGSPIVASEGTEPAELVREFGAGTVVPFGDVEAIDSALADLATRWDRFACRTRAAAGVLAARHHPSHFAAVLARSGRGVRSHARAADDPACGSRLPPVSPAP